MKQFFLMICTSLALITSVQAQTQSPLIGGGSDSLSMAFSQEFQLDTPFIMNYFAFTMNGQVTAAGDMHLEDVKLNSAYTVSIQADLNEVRTMSHDNHLDVLKSAISAHINDKISRHEISVEPGRVNGEAVDMSFSTSVIYSPVFYAKTGDTLHCTRQQLNQVNSFGEKATMFYRFDFRNGQRTPYYALVRRSEKDITLHYFDTLTNQPFLIEKYIAPTPDKLLRHGHSTYIENKKVQLRQFFETDTMRYAEEFDINNKISAKYFVQMEGNNIYPRLKYKELYYPSGNLQLRIVYPNLMMMINKKYNLNTYAYREDGSEAKYKPSPNIEAVVEKYFRKNFKVPKVSGTDGINRITPKLVLSFHIDADGNMQFLGRALSSTDWSYNYQVGTNTRKIDQIIKEHYAPYMYSFMDQLSEQTLVCKPATIDKQPVESTYIFCLEYDFIP